MTRRDFADILASSGFDYKREYWNLHEFMFGNKPPSTWNSIERHFSHEYFDDTSVSLKDFDARYGFKFNSSDITLEDLITLCEYVINLLDRSLKQSWPYNEKLAAEFSSRIELILRVAEKAGFEAVDKTGLVVFVERNPLADEAATVLPDPISWQQLIYSHRSLRGDLDEKRIILLGLADYLEPRRPELDAVNKRLSGQVFACLNKLNIRHNNLEPGSKNFNSAFAALSDAEREDVYDRVRRLLLLSVLEIEYGCNDERLQGLIGGN